MLELALLRFFIHSMILHFINSYSYVPDIKQRMINHKIIPDLISEGPTNRLKIFYPIDGVVKEIRTGQSLVHTETEKEPQLEWPSQENKWYTLFMSVRAPIYEVERERKFKPSLGNQTHIQWENWIVVNIPELQIANGSELLPYRPLETPVPNTQDLIMIFIWEQPGYYESIKFDQHMGARQEYGNTQLIRTFAGQFKFGAPWAGDFFYLRN